MNKEVFRIIRLARGYTQRELAEKLGVSYGLVAQIEAGNKKISARVARKFTEVCNVTDDDLLNARHLLNRKGESK
ncbi:helix-turn-helix protein [Geobacillus sp. BCO2]|nr:helix-turn-helix protein [Geobacillus sp. BCO2]